MPPLEAIVFAYFSVASSSGTDHNILPLLVTFLNPMKININCHLRIIQERSPFKQIVKKSQVMTMKWWFKIRPIASRSSSHRIPHISFNSNNIKVPTTTKHDIFQFFFLIFLFKYLYPCKSLLVFLSIFFWRENNDNRKRNRPNVFFLLIVSLTRRWEYEWNNNKKYLNDWRFFNNKVACVHQYVWLSRISRMKYC